MNDIEVKMKKPKNQRSTCDGNCDHCDHCIPHDTNPNMCKLAAKTIERLEEELEKVKRERDAAMKVMADFASNYGDNHVCKQCKHDLGNGDCEVQGFTDDGFYWGDCEFEWCGPRAENGGTKDEQ